MVDMKDLFDYPKHAFKEYEGRSAINMFGDLKLERGNLYLLLKFIEARASLMSSPAYAIFECRIYNIHRKKAYIDKVSFIIRGQGYKWLTNKSAREFVGKIFE